MFENQATNFGVASNGSPILARPFTDATTGLPQAILVAFPGSSTGNINVHAASGNFYGGNFDLTERTYDAGWFRLNTLAGYRYFSYSESLGIQQNLFPTTIAPGTTVNSNDNFATRNVFNGFDMGLRTQFFWNTLSLELLGKVALGSLHTSVNINGNQTTTAPGVAPVVSAGGVYALGSNIGSYNANRLQAMPEVGAAVRWQPTSNVQFRLGYSLLMLEGIARAGDQIDATINTANLPPATTGFGANRPTFNLQRTELLVQSVSFGMVFSY